MPLALTRTIISGFENIRINNGLLELVLIPELGGKICNLRDLRTGREWLWRHPRMEYKKVPHGSSYVEVADTGGWDECFPSVAACKYPSTPWADAPIQDHGELWSQTPELEIDQQPQKISILTRWQGVVLPYIFERTITVDSVSTRLRVDYCVKNTAGQPINYIWSIHPLLAIEPGMQLSLPALARFNSNGTTPPNLLPSNSNIIYPFAMPGLDLPLVPEPSAARSIKIWSDALPEGEGWGALSARNGELRMHWDVTALPQVGVWMNFGAWSADGGAPYFNLGLEPCIGAQDSLAEAVTEYKQFAVLPPHSQRTWWLEIELLS